MDVDGLAGGGGAEGAPGDVDWVLSVHEFYFEFFGEEVGDVTVGVDPRVEAHGALGTDVVLEPGGARGGV